MNQIFQNYDEIDLVIQTIRDELNQAHETDPPSSKEMAAAKRLAEKLRQELLDGGVAPEQIVDANEIVYWFLDKEAPPGTWQYHFANCLASLLINYDESLGVPRDAKDSFYRNSELMSLEKECLAVLSADLARIREFEINSLTPLAERGRQHSTQQSKRAKKPRSKLTDIIKQLTHQHPEETAKELWPHLNSAMDNEGLNPKAIEHFDKWKYEYDFGDGRKTITFGQFANIVSELKSG